MSHRPKVSCIITTYNRKEFIKDAIDSVLAQRFNSFELIVVDDGSTDSTNSIVKQYGSKIRYINQSHRGISAARNLGLEMAIGRYIAYLDSDDLWNPDKLLIQTHFMDQNPEYCLCYTEEIWYRNGVRVNPRKRHRKYSGYIFPRCLPLCIISPSSAMMHRNTLEVLGGFDEDLPATEDYDLWLRLTSKYSVFLIPLALIIKRGGHKDQLSKTINNLDRYRIRALEKIILDKSLSKAYRKYAFEEFAKKCHIYTQGCKKRDRIKEATYYLNLYNKILAMYLKDDG